MWLLKMSVQVSDGWKLVGTDSDFKLLRLPGQTPLLPQQVVHKILQPRTA